MSYRKSSRTVLQQLTAIGKRAHQWAKIKPVSQVVQRDCGWIVHAGVAY